MSEPIEFFMGMDLGDAESVVAVCLRGPEAALNVIPESRQPTVLVQNRGKRDHYARLIGYNALKDRYAEDIDVSFKWDPIKQNLQWNTDARRLQAFAEELHKLVLQRHPDLRRPHQLFIGCPTSWDRIAVERYERLFRESSEFSGAEVRIVIRESRAALLQAWEFEKIPMEALSGGVIVIDIGSSTIDCSIVRDTHADDHEASSEFGLSLVDDQIYGEHVTRHGEKAYGDNQGYMRYLCRMHKERWFGATPDLPRLPSDRPTLQREWELLSDIDVLQLLEKPGGFLDKYREEVLAKLAGDSNLEGALVLITGGGARIGRIVTATESAFPGRVKVAQEPMNGVAMGLAARGWQDYTMQEFEADAKMSLCSEAAMTEVRELYPEFIKKSFSYIDSTALKSLTKIVKGIVIPGARPSEASLTVEARQLIASWAGTVEDSSLLSDFSDAISVKLESQFDDIAGRYSIRIGTWRPRVRLDVSELLSSQDVETSGRAEDDIIGVLVATGVTALIASIPLSWAAAAAAILIGILPQEERVNPQLTKKAMELLDERVKQAIMQAVKDSLAVVRALLLDATRGENSPIDQ